MRRAVIAFLLLLAVAPTPAPAGAQPAPGEALVEVCRTSGLLDVPDLGPRACASLEAGATLLAQLCGLLPVPAETCADLTDGQVVDESQIDAYEHSWVWRALRLQDRLDDDQPLRQSLWVHTHNSFNSSAYPPSVANIDPNQRYSVLDQLRMGVRAIELDVHWVGGRVVLCHGRTVALGDLVIHLGCSIDRPFVDGLRELRTFLDAPGNADQVVLLYLENQLDGVPAAHDQVAATLADVLGPLVLRPPADAPCADLPLDLTTDQIRATGARVVIVGNCGPGAWGTWVHERGSGWDETGDAGAYPAYPACIDAERVPGDYDHRWTRIYEDSTWLSSIVYGPRVPLDADAVRSMVRCGVDMIGFDRLQPFDGRLEAMVWSWAPDEPADDPGRRCVGDDADGRFRMAPCGEPRHYACRTDGGDWVVPAVTGPGSPDAAAEACATAGTGAVPATPPTGWENERLRAAAGSAPVWLSLTAADVGLAGPTAPETPETPETPGEAGPAATGGSLPTTGSAPNTAVAVPLALLALVLWQISCAWRTRSAKERRGVRPVR